MDEKLLIVLAGPTASGKTTQAIKLACQLKAEIISADSRQIYKEMHIGTAVPSKDELAAVPHHFIQSHSIHSYYNASMYELEVMEKLQQLFKKYNQVIITGGSGMYIDAVCNGIDDLPTIDTDVRQMLLEQFKNQGIVHLQKLLKEFDPIFYQTVDINNHSRLLKALEVYYMTGKPYSSFLTREKKCRPFTIQKKAILWEREDLYQRINQRVDMMMENGLLEEARSLYQFKDCVALKTVGYRELFDYFEGKTNLDQAISLIKQNTRHYAKRQMTWFMKDKSYEWVSGE